MASGSPISSALARVAGGTMLSRILGFARDIISAAAFGAGPMWDAFIIAFTLPNVFRRILGEGAFSSAFIPLFSREREEKGEKRAAQWAANVLGRLFSLLVVIGGIGAIALEGVALFAGSEKWTITASLGAVLFPFVIPVCAVAGMGALLNAYKHFTQPALVSSVINIFWIATAILVLFMVPTPEQGARWLCWALLAAGVVQYALHWGRLKRQGCVILPRWGFDDATREVWSKMLPALLGLGAIQINTVLDRLIASAWAPEGGVSVLFYANRIMQFPLALIGIAVATAAFPYMADAASANRRDELGRFLGRGQLWVLIGAVPAMVIGILFSDLIITVAFERGAFGVQEGDRTALSLIAYLTGLVFYCAAHPTIKAFHSLGDTATPAKIGGLMVGVNLGLNLLLVHPFEEMGLALSTAVCGALSLIWHIIILRKREGILALPPRGKALKVSVLALLSSTVVWILWFFGEKWGLEEILGPEKSSSPLISFTLLLSVVALVGVGYITIVRKVVNEG